MEPTITFTFNQAFTISGAVIGIIGTLFGSWLTLILRKTPEVIDMTARQKQLDHEAECLRYRAVMQDIGNKTEASMRRIEENTDREFAELRKGVEGLYQRRGWFR